MNYQYTPYIWPLILSAAITLFLGVTVFLGQRHSRGALYFILSMFVLTLWSLPNAMEMMAKNLPAKLFWANMQYFAYCFSPVTLMALCMEFTGFDQWIKNKKMLLFTIIPAVTVILVWTNSYHGLIRYNVHLDYQGLFPVIAKNYGIAFYIHAVYSHILNISALVILVKSLFSKSTVYKKQVVALLIGACLIIVPNVIYISGLSPFDMDITPAFFGPAGIITAWAIYRYKLFEIVPLARTMIIRNMNTGFMVMDLQDRVLDMNSVLLNIIGITPLKYFDLKVEDVCSKVPEFAQACKNHSLSHSEFTIINREIDHIYEVIFSPITDKKGKQIGRLAVICEITEKKRAQQEFLKQQWTLAGNKEKERLARDLHDNLGQLLGFINLQAQGINKELSNAGVNIVSEKLEQLIEVTQMAHKEIRDYIHELRASVNSAQDFVNAFKQHISFFENQAGLKVIQDISCDLAGEELKPYIWINILNIIKEALNNIQKHAEAKKVKISLYITGKQLYVSIEDDGKGFDRTKENCSSKTRFGLNIMQERTALIGGEISIQSEIGKGTRIILSVPLEQGGIQCANESDAR